MAHRRRPAVKRRPARKKKNDPTVTIILFVGIGFLVIAAGVYFVSTQKAPKVAKKKRPQQVDVEGEEFSRPEPTSKPKSKPQPVAPRPKPKPDLKTDFSPVFNPASLNRLPLAVALPEDEGLLAESVSFPPNANCRLELDVPAYGDAHDMKIARDPKRDGRWQIVIPAQDTPVAEITLDEDGIFFSWGPAYPPQVATLLHNCMLSVRAGKHKKKMLMRIIEAAPDIRLFSRRHTGEYEMSIPHAPDKIVWLTEPITPEGAPFHAPTVGRPTTEGAIPLTESYTWTPKNDTGMIRARFRWVWKDLPGLKNGTRNIQLTLTKDYQIGKAPKNNKRSWQPLTTDSIKSDFQKRVDIYEKMKNKIGDKRPTPRQFEKRDQLWLEGNALYDLYNFYQALQHHKMRLELRAPSVAEEAGESVVLAQYPSNPNRINPPIDGGKPIPPPITPPSGPDGEDAEELWIPPPRGDKSPFGNRPNRD